MTILRCLKLTKYFGGLAALKDINVEIEERTITGLIGPNGAGKTTLFNVITGLYKPNKGRVFFMNNDITGKPPHKICKMGLARTFQLTRPFLNMTVLENIVTGIIFTQKIVIKAAQKEAERISEFIGLGHKKDVLVRNLTEVERKFVELGKALAMKPKLLLIDEILAGLNPVETERALEILKRINKEEGITIFWIEHKMKAVMKISDKIIVMHYGEKIAEGSPSEIASNIKVIEAYLGERWKQFA